jgi:hypothetical protein
LKIVVKVFGVIAALLGILFFYRLFGSMRLTKVYNCSEQVILLVDETSSRYDNEIGVSVEESEEIRNSAEENLNELNNIESCASQDPIFGNKGLNKSYLELHSSAVAYLEKVEDMAQEVSQENDTYDQLDELQDLYNDYGENVEEFNQNIEESQKKYLLKL